MNRSFALTMRRAHYAEIRADLKKRSAMIAPRAAMVLLTSALGRDQFLAKTVAVGTNQAEAFSVRVGSNENVINRWLLNRSSGPSASQNNKRESADPQQRYVARNSPSADADACVLVSV